MRKIKFEEGKFYHIVNRGTDKRLIFNEDRDRWRFLQGLFLFNNVKKFPGIWYELKRGRGSADFTVIKKFIEESNEERNPLVKILADCLMPNHFHLILEEVRRGGISEFMQRLGTGYTKYFNDRYERTGSLFEGTFKAVEIDNDEYLKYVLIYINIINPGQLIDPKFKKEGVENIDKIFNYSEAYDWSTNKEYLGTRNSIIINKGLLGEVFLTGDEYKSFARNILLGSKYNKAKEFFLE